jgi:hypothetical protein
MKKIKQILVIYIDKNDCERIGFERVPKDKYMDLFFWSDYDKEYLHTASWDLENPNMVHTGLLSRINRNMNIFNDNTFKIIYRDIEEYKTSKRWEI